MDGKSAIAASRSLADRMGVKLGRFLDYRVFGDDQNAARWAVIFSAPRTPLGWEWLAVVDDSGEEGSLIAVKRSTVD
jgi:hypothetical protein